MNFILNFIGTILGKLFNGNGSKTENSEENINVSRTENTNIIADATAVIICVCAIALAIFWILQYGLAGYFLVKDSLSQGHVVSFQVDTKKLFDMIYSLLGLGAVGIVHRIARKLLTKKS
jgi:hypothetical protein